MGESGINVKEMLEENGRVVIQTRTIPDFFLLVDESGLK